MIMAGIADGFDSWDFSAGGAGLRMPGTTAYDVLRRESNREDGSDAVNAEVRRNWTLHRRCAHA